MMAPSSDWRAVARRLRWERRPGDRVVRCFADRPGRLDALVERAARERPQAEALVSGDERLTWLELDARIAALAGGMARAGIEHGERIVMLLGNGLPFVLVFFAAARLGAVTVPVSVREQRAGLEYVIGDCQAAALFYEAAYEAAAPGPAGLARLKLALDVDGAAFADLVSGSPAPAAPASQDDVAVILYTSGTTGHPKGAMLSHANLIHSTLNYAYCMEMGPADRCLVAAPMSHVTGLVASITAPAYAQGAMIVLQSFSAARFLELADKERMTHTVMVPAMYNLCLMSPSFERRNLAAWRVAGYGGAPMALATIERLAEALPGLRLMNCYGATETTGPAVMMPPALAVSHRGSVGLPAPGVEIIVMNHDGREVPRGQIGEIWIGGALVAQGYWGAAAATASEFVGSFWRSGDLGTMDEAGFVYVHDRKKDMINRGGYKIFSAEVESVLTAQAGVAEAAVVGRPCAVLGERVHAVVVLAEGARDIPKRTLRAALGAALADYKVPETWSITREPLPRNPNGKVMKRLLREALEPHRHGEAAKA